jgi:hypothetical protein
MNGLANQSIPITVLVFSLFTGGILALWKLFLLFPPVKISVDLKSGMHIDKKIRIPISDRYFLYLTFDRAGHAFTNLCRLIGDNLKNLPGVPTPVTWKFIDEKVNATVLEAAEDYAGSNSWSGAEVGRLLQQFEIPAGRYRFVADISPASDLAKLNCRIELRLHPEFSHSKQVALVNWVGTFLIMFVLAPVALISAGILVYRFTYGG